MSEGRSEFGKVPDLRGMARAVRELLPLGCGPLTFGARKRRLDGWAVAARAGGLRGERTAPCVWGGEDSAVWERSVPLTDRGEALAFVRRCASRKAR